MEYKTLLTKLHSNGILVLTLNRPEKLNAFNIAMQTELVHFFENVNSDDAVKAVIVTGAGRAFCAGADLSSNKGDTFNLSARANERQTLRKGNDDVRRDGGGLVSLAIYNCLKPVIGAINGHAVGVGITMTLPMDVRLVSKDAKVGFVFAKRGITPEACSSFFLPRIVGPAKAVEWCVTGRVFKAQEAYDTKLVSYIYDESELMSKAMELAEEIAECAPVSVAMARKMMWHGAGISTPMRAHEVESAAIVSRGGSEDAQEGVNSFLEKRSANYPNKPSSQMPNFYPWWDEENFNWIGDES